jgi:hypothetical protein
VKCLPAGFFIRPDYPFLGTSPDGVIDDEYLIEVKCPYSGRNENVVIFAISPSLEAVERHFR